MRARTLSAVAVFAAAGASAAVLTGQAAQGDYTTDAPGVTRRITLGDLPAPGAGKIGIAPPAVVARPAGAKLSAPPGFAISEFAALQAPRQLRTAPDGDVFVSETAAGRVKVLRAPGGAAKAATVATFAAGLDRPFGVAFYPPGPTPQWIYIANANAVVRYSYRNGDLRPRGPAQVIVPLLAASTSDHSTRDILFSPDGKVMYVSVGSGSNDAEGMGKKTLAEAKAWDAAHSLGAAWGNETDRADVLAFDPMGGGRRVFAAGLRNCVSWTFSRGPASCGAPPTSATCWVMICRRTMSPACAPAPSTRGPGTTWAPTRTRITRASGRTWPAG
jgi:hypothetical protein